MCPNPTPLTFPIELRTYGVSQAARIRLYVTEPPRSVSIIQVAIQLKHGIPNQLAAHGDIEQVEVDHDASQSRMWSAQLRLVSRRELDRTWTRALLHDRYVRQLAEIVLERAPTDWTREGHVTSSALRRPQLEAVLMERVRAACGGHCNRADVVIALAALAADDALLMRSRRVRK